MSERKHHLKLQGFYTNENYESKQTARGAPVPLRDRVQHGASLRTAFSNALGNYQQKRQTIDSPLSEELGIYIELTSFPNLPLPFDNIDNKSFRLKSLSNKGNIEHAVVFVPESKRNVFHKKIEEYLDNSRLNEKGEPRNHKLIDSIRSVRLADIKSFWTDNPDYFPEDRNQQVWLELWLGKESNTSQEFVSLLAERLGGELGNSAQTFFDCTVHLIKVSISQLENAVYLISNLKELRWAKEVPVPIVSSEPQEQLEWANNVLQRISNPNDASTSVVILDTGVNYNNPLLSSFSNASYSECWLPTWPHYDNYILGSPPYSPHGSLQAGIAAYGDLQKAALSNDNIEITHIIESGRILPPTGTNDPKLYGEITLGTLNKLEINNPNISRVYSLAVTSDPEYLGGQPSSWSSQLDDSAFNFSEDFNRLFIISTGNNRAISPYVDYWEQAHLSQIEDPAQAWNAITVGAYTELTTVDEYGFDDWSPFAEAGDVSPSARTSVNWGWKRHAPYKPELVAEAGNRLLSPDKQSLTEADTVSLLTTSGRTIGRLFETTIDSSAATAVVSNYAAQLMAEYPDLWPETVRGLLIHSANWTDKMLRRFNALKTDHTQTVAKETMLRSVGYGVPNFDRAKYSLTNELTMVAENTITPFEQGSTTSSDPKLGNMQLYQLPWPASVLRDLPNNINVKLKVTLSYFIEPNPSRRGFKQRYSYQSHALRFEVIRPGQTLSNFKGKVNALMADDNYDGPEGDGSGWKFGSDFRKRGSIHSDIWTGSPQDLADMHTIAICPVGGWWKYKTGLDRWQNDVRYSLLISLEAPDVEIDLYSEIVTLIENTVVIET